MGARKGVGRRGRGSGERGGCGSGVGSTPITGGGEVPETPVPPEAIHFTAQKRVRAFQHRPGRPSFLDPVGSTLIPIDGNHGRTDVDVTPISAGNLQIHINGCDRPPPQ
jgi:hypothetical protein